MTCVEHGAVDCKRGLQGEPLSDGAHIRFAEGRTDDWEQTAVECFDLRTCTAL